MSIAPPVERLNAILARHDIIMATLNAGPDAESFVALSRELAELDPVVGAIRAYQAAEENLRGLEAKLLPQSRPCVVSELVRVPHMSFPPVRPRTPTFAAQLLALLYRQRGLSLRRVLSTGLY